MIKVICYIGIMIQIVRMVGKIYYVDHNTQQTSWERPGQFVEATAADPEPYYAPQGMGVYVPLTQVHPVFATVQPLQVPEQWQK
jgi:hypothetical protein